MPGLDLSQVSSNWKKLQATLRTSKTHDDGPKKRKRADEKTDRPRQRRRRPHGMGSILSAPTASSPSATAVAAVAAPIPPQTTHRDYKIPPKPPPTHLDTINGGLHPTNKAGKYLSLDCEMVGTGAAPPYTTNVLARASLVNFHGAQIYDSYVLPPPGVEVKDLRTRHSGVTAAHLLPGCARPFEEVQEAVAALLRGRVLVGHALHNDLRVLMLQHPRACTRDTSAHKRYRVASRGRAPALRDLAEAELGWKIQVEEAGGHSSLEDARAAMMLFRLEKGAFEGEARGGGGAWRGWKAIEENSGDAGLNLLDGEEEERREEEGEEDDDAVESDDGDGGTKPAASAARARRKSKKKKRTKRK